MNFILTERDSKRIIAIVDQTLAEFFKKNIHVFELHPVESVGSFNYQTDKGSISGISASATDSKRITDSYKMINTLPEGVTMEEGYKLILE